MFVYALRSATGKHSERVGREKLGGETVVLHCQMIMEREREKGKRLELEYIYINVRELQDMM